MKLLELLSELVNRRVGFRGGRRPTLQSLRDRPGHGTEYLDEDPANGGQATEINPIEFVHDAPPSVGGCGLANAASPARLRRECCLQVAQGALQHFVTPRA